MATVALIPLRIDVGVNGRTEELLRKFSKTQTKCHK